MAQGNTPKDQGSLVKLSKSFGSWLEQHDCSLGLTTYQAQLLFLIGRNPDGSPRIQAKTVSQCQGLWTDGQSLLVSGSIAMWRFENALADHEESETGGDRLFMPREARITGKTDVHDIAMGDLGQFGGPDGQGPIFVSTAFNCLATFSAVDNARPLWRPSFISEQVEEDRCHLNGLAMDGDRAAYVTAVSQTNVQDVWRDHRRDGGVVLDVASSEPVATGLSMPHSPRLYDGKLWVLNSGMGELTIVDPVDGRVTPVAFCPGYARGLSFIGRYAVIGLSRPRNNRNFEGLMLDERLKATNIEPRSGLIIVDIDSGKMVEWLLFEHTVDELYDVAIMPGARQPELIGFDEGDEIGRITKVSE